MMNIAYIQRLLFLCVSVLHSAEFHNISKGDFTFTEESPYVMAFQQEMYGSARVCPATNVGGEVDGAWGQDRLNPAENEPWPMFWDHPLQPTNPLDAPVEDDAWMYGSGAPLINQTANWCSGPVIDERFLPGTNVGGEAGGAWMQDGLNPEAEAWDWKESAQSFFPQGDSDDEVDLTGDISNIENDSSSSHSQLKKSLNDDAKKTMSRSSPRKLLSEQQYRDSEIILRLRGNVAAIFRYQIRLRQSKHKRLSGKEDAQADVDEEIDELKILASAEGADLKPDRLQIIQDWKDSQSQVTAGKEARPKISEKFKVIEALRELTKYKLEDGTAVKKSQSRVTDDQGRGVWTGEANREWRDDGTYRDSDPFLAGPVSGGVTSDDTDVIERAQRVIANELRGFLRRGKNRVSHHQEFFEFSAQKKKEEGTGYDCRFDPYDAKLAGFKRTRRGFLLSLVHHTKLKIEKIAEIIQGLPKQSSDAEESDVQHLLGVRQGLESDARNNHTTVAEMAKHEAEKAQRKRTATKERATSQKKRCS